MKELISIGIPVYNGEKFICSVINSLLSQSYYNIELIISDNFSNDLTQNICEEFANKDSRIKYYRQSRNIGMFPNFNFVFKKSLGKYFMWAAADDKFDFDFITQAVDILDKNPECISVFAHFEIFDLYTGNIIEKITPSSISSDLPNLRIKRILEECHPNLMYGLHRKSLIIDNYYETIDWSDMLFLSRLVSQGKYYIIPKVLYWIGINGTKRVPYSITGKWLNLFQFAVKYSLLARRYSPNVFSFFQTLIFLLKVISISSFKVNKDIFIYRHLNNGNRR